MKVDKQKLIVVLGMHRSGTSAVTRGLRVIGVRLGKSFIPPAEGNNSAGFWEDADLNAFNIEVLKALESDWHGLSTIKEKDVENLRAQGYFTRAVELLRQKTSNEPVYGFKDPRVAKLLPFWKEVFAHCQLDVGFLIVVRNPLSVARSLAKRDGFDGEKSHLLWLSHVIASLRDSGGGKRMVVDYDILMQSASHELERIARFFDLKVDPKELKEYSSEFLDQNLRHTIYESMDLLADDACPPLVREVYAELLDLAMDKAGFDDPAIPKKIECWARELDRMKSALTLVDRLYEQKVAISQLVAERDGQIASLNEAVAERDGQIADQANKIKEIFQSNSWRLSAPLRWFGKQIHRFSVLWVELLSVRAYSGRRYQLSQFTPRVFSYLKPRYAHLQLSTESDQHSDSIELPRVAVHIHIHYTDLLDELLEDVSHLPGAPDIFVTTTQSVEQIKAQVHTRFPRATVWQTDNRGKDIGPFMDALQRYKLDEYDLVLKLHGKKSLNTAEYLNAVRALFDADIRSGEDWRRGLIEPLTASSERVMKIYHAFAVDTRLGIVGAERFICRAPDADQLGYKALCRRLDIGTDILFFAGTIFWIRGRHLRRLRKASLDLQDFNAEAIDNVQGMLEHACERVFGALAAADGGYLGGVK